MVGRQAPNESVDEITSICSGRAEAFLGHVRKYISGGFGRPTKHWWVKA
jgi:hypothetical protein